MTGRRSLREALGFTMVEVLTALMVMSVVVRIGIPNYQEILLKAEATRALADFELVRLAAFEFQADNHTWPQDAAAGQVPPGLEPYLPEGYSFHRGLYDLDWESWVLPSGLPAHADARGLVGVSVVTEDQRLGAALETLVGSNASHFSLGDTYTFLVDSY